jgi:hypothetical protein
MKIEEWTVSEETKAFWRGNVLPSEPLSREKLEAAIANHIEAARAHQDDVLVFRKGANGQITVTSIPRRPRPSDRRSVRRR